MITQNTYITLFQNRGIIVIMTNQQQRNTKNYFQTENTIPLLP